MKVGDKVIIFNGGDSEYESYFKILTKKEAVLVINKEKKVKNSTDIELHLFVCLLKKDNFELIVEKCTEIGAFAFHPIISERSEKKKLNIERLNKIAKEAVEQSGRIKLPEIFNSEKLEKIVSSFDGELFVLDKDADEHGFEMRINTENFSHVGHMKKCVENRKKIGIFIGPEGGWSEKEKILFKQKGIKSISFGSQTLRAETATIVASVLIIIK